MDLLLTKHIKHVCQRVLDGRKFARYSVVTDPGSDFLYCFSWFAINLLPEPRTLWPCGVVLAFHETRYFFESEHVHVVAWVQLFDLVPEVSTLLTTDW